MIKQILKMGGCKTEKEFYKKYPTEESFLEAFPQAQRMMKQYKKGGSADLAFPQAPTAERFFNYGLPTMNIPRAMQTGGESQQVQNAPVLEMITAIAEYNEMEEADVIQLLQENVPAEELQLLTDQAVSDPETVAKTLNQYVQQLSGNQEQETMESQYLEGQPLMRDMLERQAMAQQADEEAMPMDPNMAMQMAYGGSKLRKFTKTYQPGGQKKPTAPSAPAEEDSFWSTGWGTAATMGASGLFGALAVNGLSRLANSDTMRRMVGIAEAKWKNLTEGQRLKRIGAALKRGAMSKTGAGVLLGATVAGIGELFDWRGTNPEVKAAPANKASAPLIRNQAVPVDSSDADRVPTMVNDQGKDSLRAVQEQMLLDNSNKRKPVQKGVKFNYKDGGQSVPMGVSSNDDVVSRRMEKLRKFVSDNVYNNMLEQEAEDIKNAFTPQNQMMGQGEEQEYMKFGGRLKKKGHTDQRLRMALQGRLDYMEPGGQSDGLSSAFGFVFPPAKTVGDMFDRRTTGLIDAPASNVSTTGPVQGQGTAINMGGYTNLSQPSGAYNTYAPQQNETTQGIMNMAQNQNEALDQYEVSEGTGKQCPEGYKWDPKRGQCVVAQTRAGKALDKVGEWWQNKSGDERANLVLGMANSVVGAKEQQNQRKYEEQLQNQMYNLFTTSVTAPTDKGMHMVNQRTPVPPTMMTPVQFTGKNYTQGYGYAQMGGEMYLSDDEIQNIISLGGQVEYLD